MEGQRATDIDGLYNGMGTGESRKTSSMPYPAMTACQQVAWTVGWATGTKANILERNAECLGKNWALECPARALGRPLYFHHSLHPLPPLLFRTTNLITHNLKV